MEHAREEALNQLADLLTEIRKFENLREKKRGVFYRKSQAFLHFHEDKTGLFADLRIGSDWERHPVNIPAEQQLFLDKIIAVF
ncbi:MAG: hypothetical protein F6K19_22765 [Cyanothece sp. SIO1E1]|nr:hypothetical protein [Cyanothece sp. SIO1E1]